MDHRVVIITVKLNVFLTLEQMYTFPVLSTSIITMTLILLLLRIKHVELIKQEVADENMRNKRLRTRVRSFLSA